MVLYSDSGRFDPFINVSETLDSVDNRWTVSGRDTFAVQVDLVSSAYQLELSDLQPPDAMSAIFRDNTMLDFNKVSSSGICQSAVGLQCAGYHSMWSRTLTCRLTDQQSLETHLETQQK